MKGSSFYARSPRAFLQVSAASGRDILRVYVLLADVLFDLSVFFPFYCLLLTRFFFLIPYTRQN